jgi:hypothetical protein
VDFCLVSVQLQLAGHMQQGNPEQQLPEQVGVVTVRTFSLHCSMPGGRPTATQGCCSSCATEGRFAGSATSTLRSNASNSGLNPSGGS